MTLVSAIRLGPHGGIFCSDNLVIEDGDDGEDKLNSSPYLKIERIGQQDVIVGSAGDAADLQEIIEFTKDEALKLGKMHFNQTIDYMQKKCVELERRMFTEKYLDKYGLTYEEFTNDKIGLGLSERFHIVLNSHDLFNNSLLIGGVYTKPNNRSEEIKDFSIYQVNNGVRKFVRAFGSIGIGTKLANSVIDEIINETYDNTPLPLAARALLTAQVAVKQKKAYVGGESKFVWIVDNKYGELGPPETNVLEGALLDAQNGIIAQACVEPLFCSAFERGARKGELLELLYPYVPKEKVVEIHYTNPRFS